ncbi:MAG: hypothetical protein Q9217_001756 [Psora testacea]
MAILTSSTLLRAISLFHLTISYYLLTAPSVLTNQNLVVILGAAMDIPLPSPSLSMPSSSTAIASIFLALLAVSDLTASSMPEEVSGLYWSSQAPLRLAFFFGITGWAYLGKFGLEGRANGTGLDVDAGVREVMCNSFVFSWGFVEMLTWFWIYTTLREERTSSLSKQEQKRKVEEDRL